MEDHPLKAFQEREQLSQSQLAKLLKVSRPTITRWLNGTRQLDEDKILVIAEKTGIPARDLRPDLAALFSEPGK